MEYPEEVRAIQTAGHSVDSHLHTHTVTLLDTIEEITAELQCAEYAFCQNHIQWHGIGATGMYPKGIDGYGEVIKLLQDRGYHWCSSKFNVGSTIEEMQPYWLSEGLLEIPCAGWSDMGWWHYADMRPVHPQNHITTQTLKGFIQHTVSHLRRACKNNLLYAIDLHAGALSKYDQECHFLTTLLTEAKSMDIPVIDMNQVWNMHSGSSGY